MIMTTVVLLAGFSSVLASDSRDHRAFATLGMVTLGIALLCDIFCLPALVAIFDRPPRQPPSSRSVQSRGLAIGAEPLPASPATHQAGSAG